MRIDPEQISDQNRRGEAGHRDAFDFLASRLDGAGHDVDTLLKKITKFPIAIPRWGLGSGGTRFARFPGGGEPRSLEEKMLDGGLLHAINRSGGALSLHIPWDIPTAAAALKAQAGELDLEFDAVNSNTFQDQPDQDFSYKFGSLSHTEKSIRQKAVAHNIEVIHYGKALGSKALTVWLADGSCFPGQANFAKSFQRTLSSLQEIYAALPDDWKIFVEYKPYEPNFYSTVIQDWGTSVLLANELGEKAYTLVDLGHPLPNTNIEQIVATLMMEGKLG